MQQPGSGNRRERPYSCRQLPVAVLHLFLQRRLRHTVKPRHVRFFLNSSTMRVFLRSAVAARLWLSEFSQLIGKNRLPAL